MNKIEFERQLDKPQNALNLEIYSVENGYIVRPARSFVRSREDGVMGSSKIWIAANQLDLQRLIGYLASTGEDING